MKIIRKNQINNVDNSPTNHVEEYPHNDSDINLAIVTSTMRYPESDFVINQKCKELVYVLEGHIKLIQPDLTTELEVGDSVIIDALEPFAWDGSAKILTVCTPAWTVEQHVPYSLP